MFFWWIFIVVTALSLLWSITLVALIFLSCFVYFLNVNKKSALLFLIWGIAGCISWTLLSFEKNEDPTMQPWLIVEWKVIRTVKKDQYETLVNWNSFLVKTSKAHREWDLINILISKVIVSEQRKMNRLKPSFHWVFIWEFEYSLWLKMKWYAGLIYTKDTYTTKLWSSWLRVLFKERIKKVFWEWRVGWLLEWMTIGWKAGLTEWEYEYFLKSGLVHIIAVSWSNIALLVLTLRISLFFLPVFLRRGVIFMCLWLYLTICWMDSSLLRALWMWWIVLLCATTGMRASWIRIMRYSLIGIILMNPYMLRYDLWLLLSVMSVLWIYLVTKWSPSNKLLWYVYTMIALPTAAWLAALPVIYSFIWTTTLQSFIANILVGPIIAPSLLLWLVSLFIPIEPLTAITYQLFTIVFDVSEHFWTSGLSVNNDISFHTVTIVACLIVTIWTVFVVKRTSASNHQKIT